MMALTPRLIAYKGRQRQGLQCPGHELNALALQCNLHMHGSIVDAGDGRKIFSAAAG